MGNVTISAEQFALLLDSAKGNLPKGKKKTAKKAKKSNYAEALKAAYAQPEVVELEGYRDRVHSQIAVKLHENMPTLTSPLKGYIAHADRMFLVTEANYEQNKLKKGYRNLVTD